jgi:hypothetical protein
MRRALIAAGAILRVFDPARVLTLVLCARIIAHLAHRTL